MPFRNGQFDFVTAFETVFFWPNLSENIKKVCRVLKSKGRFAIINNYGDPEIDWEKKVPCMKRYTADEIKQFMESAGFGNITIAKKGNLFLLNGERE